MIIWWGVIQYFLFCFKSNGPYTYVVMKKSKDETQVFIPEIQINRTSLPLYISNVVP